MHVLIIPSWYPAQPGDIGGSFFREQALAVHKQGCKVGVIYPQLRSLRDLKGIFTGAHGLDITDDEGLHTYRQHGVQWFPRLRRLQAQHFVRMGLRLFKAYIKDHGLPDMVHAHSLLCAGSVAAAIKRRYGIPFVVTEHSSGFARNLYTAPQLRQAAAAAKTASRCFAVSECFCQLMADALAMSVKDWHYLPNPVNAKFLDTPFCKSQDAEFIFLHVSLLNTNKAVENLIHSFAKAYAGIAQVVLNIGGDGATRRDLAQLVNKLGITSQVHFLGKLSRESVLKVMQRSDAFVLSSRYESFGVVLIEALALGKPVIATRCGGPESIVNDVNGILVPVDDVDAMAQAMKSVFSHRAEYDPIAIREDCQKRFSEQAVVKQLIKEYRSIQSPRAMGASGIKK